MVLRGELLVVPQERGGDLTAGQPFEVHRQERDVEQHVAAPQPVVERQAVEDARPVVHHEDVLREQIAVTVSRQSLPDPECEEVMAPGEVPGRQRRDVDERIGRGEAFVEHPHLRQVLLPQAGHRLCRGHPGGGFVGRLRSVERRDRSPDGTDRRVPLRTAYQCSELAVGRQTTHRDDVLGDFAVLHDG